MIIFIYLKKLFLRLFEIYHVVVFFSLATNVRGYCQCGIAVRVSVRWHI
jgi:hypothetical protein